MDIAQYVVVKQDQDFCSEAPVQATAPRPQHRQPGFPGPPISEGLRGATTLERVQHHQHLFQRLTMGLVGLWRTTRPPIHQFDQTRNSFPIPSLSMSRYFK